jgi:hypothetical protein
MNLTTSGKVSRILSYRLAATDKTIKATFTFKLWGVTIPIPVSVANPTYSGKPTR